MTEPRTLEARREQTAAATRTRLARALDRKIGRAVTLLREHGYIVTPPTHRKVTR